MEFGLPIRERPGVPVVEEEGLRQHLMDEEVEELKCAVIARDLVEIADALADIVYIAYGTALAYGVDLDSVIGEVHRTNMAKMVDGQVIRRPDGKVLKPWDWEGPRIAEVLGLDR